MDKTIQDQIYPVFLARQELEKSIARLVDALKMDPENEFRPEIEGIVKAVSDPDDWVLTEAIGQITACLDYEFEDVLMPQFEDLNTYRNRWLAAKWRKHTAREVQ